MTEKKPSKEVDSVTEWSDLTLQGCLAVTRSCKIVFGPTVPNQGTCRRRRRLKLKNLS